MTNVERLRIEKSAWRKQVIFRTVKEAIEQKGIEKGGLNEYRFICGCSAATFSNK